MKPQKHPLPAPVDQTGEPLHINKPTDWRLLQDEPIVRNPMNYNPDLWSQATGLRCDDPSLTQQQFLEEADINYIAERFMRTGEIKQVVNMPTSGDFEGVYDFQTAMNIVVEAKHEFMNLPAKIRSRFDNDPAKLIDFLQDDKNRKEAEALGLVEPKIEPTPAPVEKPAAPPSAEPGPQLDKSDKNSRK